MVKLQFSQILNIMPNPVILLLQDQAESNTINNIALMIHVEEFSLKEKSHAPAYGAFHLLNKAEFLLVLKNVKIVKSRLH